MRWGVLKYGASTNLGDNIQSIATRSFLAHIDSFVDREKLKTTAPRFPTRVIFNGWFLHSFGEWPPADSIQPIFFGFHIAKPRKLLSEVNLEYLRRFEPIGCRDLATVSACRQHGLEAYWSGCLTATLPLNEGSRTDAIYIVDVDDTLLNLVPSSIRSSALSRTHRVLKKYQSRDELKNALAEERLNEYRTAQLVVTSRLHVALPCLGFKTPVLLIHPKLRTDRRFSGWQDIIPCTDGQTPINDSLWDQVYSPEKIVLPENVGQAAERMEKIIKTHEGLE